MGLEDRDMEKGSRPVVLLKSLTVTECVPNGQAQMALFQLLTVHVDTTRQESLPSVPLS